MLTRNDRVWQKLVVATCTLNEKHLAFLCLHPVKHVGTWVVTRWCRARSRDSGKGAQGHAHHANCPHPNCFQIRCHCKRERRGRSTRITGFGDFAMIFTTDKCNCPRSQASPYPPHGSHLPRKFAASLHQVFKSLSDFPALVHDKTSPATCLQSLWRLTSCPRSLPGCCPKGLDSLFFLRKLHHVSSCRCGTLHQGSF